MSEIAAFDNYRCNIIISMCRTLAGLILTLATALTCVFGQSSSAGAVGYPRIVLRLPDSIASDTVTIWYFLMARQGKTGPVKPQRNVRQYVITGAIGGQPARSATLYVYSPGCQFKVYDFALSALTDKSDVEQWFECVPLPQKSIHGFIAPTEIPRAFFPQQTELVISGKLEADWICSDAFRRVGGGGSCGVPSIPLGKVGTLNPIEGGNFELTIPDFTEDPVFRSNSFNFGFLILLLKNGRVGCTGGATFATNSHGSKRGLEIKTDYPDPVVCAPIH
jgi:hypothetical protein